MAEQPPANRLGFNTRAIHVGQEPEPSTGAVNVPIFATSTYRQEALGRHKGYEYARTANPTRTALETCIADLENGSLARAYASGMAATATVLDLLEQGSHVIVSDDCYGGTRRVMESVRNRTAGMALSVVDLNDEAALKAALRPETRMIWVETPTNPLLKIVDLARIAAFAKEHGLISVCDNTFCSPAVQRPLDHGFDIVMHSATKYLGGHSDLLAGVNVASRNRPDLAEQLSFLTNASGPVLGPFDSYLLLRSLKTLDLRMQRHAASALSIARFLEGRSELESVWYPGLEGHPGHEVAKRQMRGFGGIVSAEVKGGLEGARRLLEGTQLFFLGESLGGAESLVTHPVSMTHAEVPEDERRALGLSDGVVRFSVGLEDEADLIADLEQALKRVA